MGKGAHRVRWAWERTGSRRTPESSRAPRGGDRHEAGRRTTQRAPATATQPPARRGAARRLHVCVHRYTLPELLDSPSAAAALAAAAPWSAKHAKRVGEVPGKAQRTGTVHGGLGGGSGCGGRLVGDREPCGSGRPTVAGLLGEARGSRTAVATAGGGNRDRWSSRGARGHVCAVRIWGHHAEMDDGRVLIGPRGAAGTAAPTAVRPRHNSARRTGSRSGSRRILALSGSGRLPARDECILGIRVDGESTRAQGRGGAASAQQGSSGGTRGRPRGRWTAAGSRGRTSVRGS